MEMILLSGGSGKRLWPLSNDSRSKQFLKVLDNNGNLESMVQRVWNQLEMLQLNESTVIATSKSQVDMIHSQLGNHIPLIIEPERRDTFPAIALAATYLYSVKESSLNEIIGILPVDPYVDISFFERIKDLEIALSKSEADLALMGVDPTFPSEKYGYIVPKQNNENDYIQVSHFKEKPSAIEAKDLMDKNALWNCGVFAFKLEYIISLLESKGLPIRYEELAKQYHNLEKISFDYAVVEKAEKIVALPYSESWKDLGTWNTLTEEMGTKQIGKGTISEDSTNTHLVNELDIPVTVLGIKDVVVAASPDGILVTDKVASPRIKEVLKGFEQRPMYEERRWGWYKVLDHTKFEEGNEVLTKRICVKAGKNLSYQKHYARSEVWTIIKGEGDFALNDEIRTVKPGDVLVIPVEAMHCIKATTDLEFIEVQTGSQLIEEDIVRIYMTWEEVEEHCNSLVK
ncbi:sugar phosphate nucleotidyltransferase [Chengkuizengella marina]|uniref:Mannose-1-phosphate guanylyltransferase n=1 Tax=Chengkuizengella marina TaxID=2507566 RepID=A0A6N9Q3D6_9BACL|nr:sugar phosphate nucleotidyltransferase [Chengkuizengella marina]NBI29335.1 mannose-1-phosphate guanylyltransferase [Chengkuizengella marina]